MKLSLPGEGGSMWETIDVIVIKGLLGASILFPLVWAGAFALNWDKAAAEYLHRRFGKSRQEHAKIHPFQRNAS